MKETEVNNFKNYLKIALIGISALLVYFILPDLKYIAFSLMDIDTQSLSMTLKIVYSMIYDILVMAIIILIFYKKLKKDYYNMLKNHRSYFSKYFKYWLAGLGIMMASNFIISLISKGAIAGNQESIVDMFAISPIYVYFAAVIYAPIIEELIFRQAIRNIFPNKIIFILISGIVFGGLHVIDNIDAWYDILYLIPYCTPGFIFAYILTKTDNIFVSMGLHFMHNGVLIAAQVFVLLFS